MSTIERITGPLPWVMLVPLALLLAIAPMGGTPHLVEKWRMLFEGTLRRPLDWFDLVLHTAPLLVLALKIAVHVPRWIHR